MVLLNINDAKSDSVRIKLLPQRTAIMSTAGSDTEEAKDLADIQTYANPDNVPIGELHRLLELNNVGTLHNKQTIDEYVKSGICRHRIKYYGDPIDMVKTREKQGLLPKSIDSVKTSVHHFDVAQFNKQLLKRANHEATRQRRNSIVVIRELDEQGAKEIIAKTEEKLLTEEKRDKPAITTALLHLSVETQLVQNEIIENLQAIGYITLDEKDGATHVSYKLPKLGEFVKHMLQHHDRVVALCCNSPDVEWDVDLAVFQTEAKRICLVEKLEQLGLEQLKPESLKALELLEHMGKSRPKTLPTLERVLQPVVRSVAITPMNMTFAKLVGIAPTLKTVKIPFGDPPVYPFSLASEDMFVVPWKASDDPAAAKLKERKKFCQKVFSTFKNTSNTEKHIQYGLADAAKQAEAVKSLQEWLENREKGIESECEKALEQSSATSGVLSYKLSCLTCVEGFTPLTREDIYGILVRMSTIEATYSEEEVMKRLQELGALKAHPDKVVFFLKTIRRLVEKWEAANKKVTSYVSNSLKQYYPDNKAADKTK